MMSSSAVAHGSRDIQGYGCSAAHVSGEIQHSLVAKCAGINKRMGSSSAGAHGSLDIQGYVCSAAHGSPETRHHLLAICVGVEKE